MSIPPDFWPYLIPAAFVVCCAVHLYNWLHTPKGYKREYGWKRLKQNEKAAKEEFKCSTCCQSIFNRPQTLGEQVYKKTGLCTVCFFDEGFPNDHLNELTVIDEFWTTQVNK